VLCAQSSTVTTQSSVDLNGNRITDNSQLVRSKSGKDSATTERSQSINGRMVPLEKVEERVIRDDASGKTIERTIRRFDPTGYSSTTIKQTVDEQKRPDGSSTTQTTTYQGDINGGMKLTEKTVTEAHPTANGQTIDTVVQRPTLNGSVDTVEKQSKVVVKEPNGYTEDTTVYRRDGNGGFGVAVRLTNQHTAQGQDSSDNTAEYEIGSDGRLQLHSQTVAKTVSRPDGTQDQVVDIFGRNVPGTASDSASLRLQEQQLIQTRNAGPDTTVQTLAVRRPTVSDPNSLGPARQISETVCKGKCAP